MSLFFLCIVASYSLVYVSGTGSFGHGCGSRQSRSAHNNTIQRNATRMIMIMIMIMRAAVIISLNFCLCLEAMADNEETRF